MLKIIILLLLSTNSWALYEKELDTIQSISDSWERNSAFDYFYNNDFSKSLAKQELSNFSEQELKDIINVFQIISFYTQNKQRTKVYLRYFNQLVKKGWAKEKDYKSVFGAMNNSRMFEEAELFYKKHSIFGLPRLVKSQNKIASNSTDLIVHSIDGKQSNTLVSETFYFSKSTEIIVISHPACHFCSRAVNEISKYKQLSVFLQNNSRWLVPPSIRWEFDKLVNWNNKHPQFDIKYIDKQTDFLQFDYWGTPTFYFLKNGEVLDQLIGWPQEGKIIELKGLIHKHFSIKL